MSRLADHACDASIDLAGGRPHVMARRILPLAAAAAAFTIVAYCAASRKLFDVISQSEPHCGTGDDGQPRFASYTPASFGTSGLPPEVGGLVDPTSYVMPAFKNVSVTSRDGLLLASWWIPAARGGAPVVVMVHGVGSCRRDPVMLLPAGMLHRNGFAVLMIDLADQGDSLVRDGRFTGGGRESLDVLGAWDWLRARGIPDGRIGLFGESNGAATVLIAAAAEPRIAAVWEDSGYADAWTAVHEEVRRRGFPEILIGGARLWGLAAGIDPDRARPLDAMAAIRDRPVMIVHGSIDSRVDPHHAFDLANALAAPRGPGGAPASPWIVPGADHLRASFVAAAEYERRLTAFFTAALGMP
ncbi:MAG: prolyl oligopeptidase family serine peptidase [Chloroflexi bacterium]|nr:prolyl oligopeptidase family serine peptidase [Chloroflexota bacterium]